ncbi:hypothetical protein GCM10007276_23120 [Agaricicola taiwanensis]|uniref:Uncharacterized protein n=1 Tax=Agaricicola taiwanensis TaxID=591372 RepID=A0A8J3DVX9_9RHOB|nr:hypothetical protein GCM10007276_23120 [Agaricicola taiwanensis]
MIAIEQLMLILIMIRVHRLRPASRRVDIGEIRLLPTGRIKIAVVLAAVGMADKSGELRERIILTEPFVFRSALVRG